MSSSASGLNALASTTTIDIYKRHVKGEKSERHFVDSTRLFTLIWGIIAIVFACMGSLFDNLIQMVNIIGSIFYGTVLGIFLVAFYIKFIKAEAIFWSAVFTQAVVLVIYKLDILSYLWLNVIGASLTILVALILQMIIKDNKPELQIETE
jgi:Na+/proline symporter